MLRVKLFILGLSTAVLVILSVSFTVILPSIRQASTSTANSDGSSMLPLPVFQTLSVPLSIEAAQVQLAFRIEMVNDLTLLPPGTRFVGAYVLPTSYGTYGNGVFLYYWNRDIVPGKTQIQEILATGGFRLYEGLYVAQNAHQALTAIASPGEIHYPNGTVERPMLGTIVASNGVEYLLLHGGIDFWRNGTLFSLQFAIAGEDPAQPLTASQQITIAKSVS